MRFLSIRRMSSRACPNGNLFKRLSLKGRSSMSVDKQAHEAQRWLETAQEDLEAARVLLREGKYSHACFLAQQSGEKAVKALWHSLGEDPCGHSIHKEFLVSEYLVSHLVFTSRLRIRFRSCVTTGNRTMLKFPVLTMPEFKRGDAEKLTKQCGNRLAAVSHLLRDGGRHVFSLDKIGVEHGVAKECRLSNSPPPAWPTPEPGGNWSSCGARRTEGPAGKRSAKVRVPMPLDI